MNSEISVYIGVKLMCDQLTDDELIGLSTVVVFGGNPKTRSWYEKVNGLFTEANGEQMHATAFRALDAVVNERFGGK